MDTKPGTEASATKEPQAKGTHEALPIGQIKAGFQFGETCAEIGSGHMVAVLGG